jgi:hypothetical protein
MTEILTESFCERCGTRYTFESARPRLRLKGVKVVSRGLKNFVLSDGTSMDEAMAAARSETEREATAYQLDAFHKTFNFCMSCRQYTCPNCWNEREARCLSCAPHLGHEVLPAPFPDLTSTSARVADDPTGGGAIRLDEMAGAAVADAVASEAPQSDFDVAARLDALTTIAEPEPEAMAAAHIAPTDVDATRESTAVSEPGSKPASESVVEAGAGPEVIDHDAVRLAALAAGAAMVERDPTPDAPVPASEGTSRSMSKERFGRFRPGQDLDAELDAYEREQAAIAAAALAASAVAPTEGPVESDVAAVAEPESEVAAVAEPESEVAAVAEPESEVAAAAADGPEPGPRPVPIADDVVPQPTWRMVAPDSPADQAPEIPAAASAQPGSEPQWPARPAWLESTPSVGLPFLGRPATPQGGLEALWAESNREVADPHSAAKPAGSVQPCVSCGLSLSGTARFCRRCGSAQAS